MIVSRQGRLCGPLTERVPACGLVSVLMLAMLVMVGASQARSSEDDPLQLLPPHMRPDPNAATGDSARPLPDGVPIPEDMGRTEPPANVPVVFGLSDGLSDPLPETLWAGTRPDRVRALLAALPLAAASPVAADLRRRLLLSPQRPPEGLDPAILLQARLDRLVAQGTSFEIVEAMAAPLRGRIAGDRAVLHAALVHDRMPEACALARSGLPWQRNGPLWDQALIACDVVDGRTGQAMLGLSVLLEDEAADAAPPDPFGRVVSRLAGVENAPPNTLAGSRPPTYAVLRRYPALLAALPDAIRPEAPWSALALALSNSAPADQRAQAAERAALSGSLAPERMAAIWRESIADARDLATPISRVVQGETAADRALAFSILERIDDPARLLEGLAHVLETSRSRTPALYGLHTRLFAPMIRNLPATQAVGAGPAFALAAMARALIVAGEPEPARPWLNALRQRATEKSDLTAEETLSLLWPLVAVAGMIPADASVAEGPVLWRQARAARLGDRDGAHEEILARAENRIRALLRALDPGAPASSRVGDDALAEAAVAGRLGETVALALIALGESGPTGAAPGTVVSVVAALRALGLQGDAWRLAAVALAAWEP